MIIWTSDWWRSLSPCTKSHLCVRSVMRLDLLSYVSWSYSASMFFYSLSNALPKVVKICVFSYFSLVSLAGAKGYSLSQRGGSIRMIQIWARLWNIYVDQLCLNRESLSSAQRACNRVSSLFLIREITKHIFWKTSFLSSYFNLSKVFMESLKTTDNTPIKKK